ncbi:MAG: TRAP transporter small permease [Proteobacteria bacterium]|nr:TRAP transporter small permease [Pseudomonadota bacterium]
MSFSSATLAGFQRAICTLTQFGVMVSGSALGLIVCAYIYEVVSRYFFDRPTLWASDLVAFLLCLSIFLILPHVSQTHGHIKIPLLEERLSDQRAGQLRRLVALISFIVCLTVAVISGLENIRQFVGSITTISVYPLPKWIISSAMTYGFGLSGIHFLLEVVKPSSALQRSAGGFS